MLSEFIHDSRVAYFSMEIALQNEIPTYAGGLGVLAGDTVRSAVDLMLPIVAISLVSRAGYFRQIIDPQGKQIEQANFWDPSLWAQALDVKVSVVIEGRIVWIGAWLYVVEGHLGGRQPVILLDTNLNENHPEDLQITHYLYGGNDVYRLKQEIVLGIGGVRMLQALGIKIRHYHMNEGHSALLGLELLRRYAHSNDHVRQGESLYDIPRVRELCCFTTHTPVEAGHDHFSYDLVSKVLDNEFAIESIKKLAGEDDLNMTRLALNLSEYVNGVAKKHAELSREMFPGYRVHVITNGVHPYTWVTESFRELYNIYIPGWCHEPQLLMRVDCCIPDAAIWESHIKAKQRLIEKVQMLTGVKLDSKAPILGFARRMTAYKRPDLLFSNIDRLKTIARRYPFQIVLAGKAHPQDQNGKLLIEQLNHYAKMLADTINIAYLPDYDMNLSKLLTAGCDVWINTPLPPLEASGTSGMKAAFNGVPNFSVLDGWWIEGCIENFTGWSVSDNSKLPENDGLVLHDKLENIVLPLYYENRTDWIRVMKGAISKNASYFNSHRMMYRYATEAYSR